MSLPADLPGQVAHVFMSSPQRDVLLNMAKEIESQRSEIAEIQEFISLSYEKADSRKFDGLPKAGSPYPIQEGDDVSTDSES